MPEQPEAELSTLALSTKVEEDFVSPLTAVRGSLEILRDFPNLDQAERQRFLEAALQSCSRLEKGVEALSKAVYEAGQKTLGAAGAAEPEIAPDEKSENLRRVRLLDELGVVEIDLEGYIFRNSDMVNEFYNLVERLVMASGRDWYFLINFANCSIWPEAWVAFAHRGKKINVVYSLGTVRYAAEEDGQGGTAGGDLDPNFLGSREAALARIEAMKADAKR